jgi:hydroxymethylbilane synthase
MQEGQCDAMILARAGVMRMQLGEFIRETLKTDVFTPAAGQASLAVEVSARLEDDLKEAIRSALNHPLSEACILAERAFLRKMEGGCSIPVFALCRPDDEFNFILEAGIISTDGRQEVRKILHFSADERMDEAVFKAAGEKLAEEVLKSGGSGILEGIKAG